MSATCFVSLIFLTSVFGHSNDRLLPRNLHLSFFGYPRSESSSSPPPPSTPWVVFDPRPEYHPFPLFVYPSLENSPTTCNSTCSPINTTITSTVSQSVSSSVTPITPSSTTTTTSSNQTILTPNNQRSATDLPSNPFNLKPVRSPFHSVKPF